MATIARRLTPQPIKLRADIELTCFQPAGIDAIKRALTAGEAVSTETVPVKAKLVAPPFYVLGTNATDKVGIANLVYEPCLMLFLYKVAGVETLEKAIEAIKVTILEDGGELNVKMKVSLSSSLWIQSLGNSFMLICVAQGSIGDRGSGAGRTYGESQPGEPGDFWRQCRRLGCRRLRVFWLTYLALVL